MNENLPTLEETAAAALDKASGAIEAVAAALTAAAEQYGETAYEMAMWVIRLDGVQSIAIGLVFIAAAVFPLRHSRRVFWTDDKPKAWDPDIWAATGVATLALASGLLFGAVCKLFSVWNFVQIFAPELWLAKYALEKVVDL